MYKDEMYCDNDDYRLHFAGSFLWNYRADFIKSYFICLFVYFSIHCVFTNAKTF